MLIDQHYILWLFFDTATKYGMLNIEIVKSFDFCSCYMKSCIYEICKVSLC